MIAVFEVATTCWPRGEQPVDEKVEPIEIGIATISKVDKVWQVTSKPSIYCKPKSSISPFCVEFNGINPAFIQEHGIPLEEALAKAGAISQDGFWASWSLFEWNLLRDMKPMYHPFGSNHLTVGNIARLHLRRNRLPLSEAVNDIMGGWKGPTVGVRSIAAHVAKILLTINQQSSRDSACGMTIGRYFE